MTVFHTVLVICFVVGCVYVVALVAALTEPGD